MEGVETVMCSDAAVVLMAVIINFDAISCEKLSFILLFIILNLTTIRQDRRVLSAYMKY